MTKPDDVCYNPSRQAGATETIKVMPEMVDAGVARLSRLDLEWDSPEQIVTAVFLAMAAALIDERHSAA
jgi:hypothetical protein